MTRRILIVGAGIAGLTLAIALHARGITSFTLLERSRSLHQAGSGLNLLPLATRELDGLGLLGTLEPLSVLLDRLNYTTWDGHLIWDEPKGRNAGFAWPQLSISRARLQGTLLRDVIARCGAAAVVSEASVVGVRRLRKEILAVCADGREFAADLVVGADGIRSALRKSLFPGFAGLRMAPTTVYRGSFWGEALLDNRTMYITGDGTSKFVVYPMFADGVGGQTQTNWAAAIPTSARSHHHPLGNWNVHVSAHEVARKFANWTLEGIRPEHAIAVSESVYAYPLVDIDPLPAWSNGEDLVLIGDAAHGMYPIGSNGATQSIVDAVALAQALAIFDDKAAALAAFERERIATVHAIQLANRMQGPEVVVDIAAERRGRHKTSLEISFPHEERRAIASTYAALTGVTPAVVNRASRYQWVNV